MATRPCPHCGECSIPAHALVGAAVGFPYHCTSCGGSVTTSGGVKLGAIVIAGVGLFAGAVESIKYRSVLGYLAAIAVWGVGCALVYRFAKGEVGPLPGASRAAWAVTAGLTLVAGAYFWWRNHFA